MGKLGRHEQVLSMYVTVLDDVNRAIEYCDKVYKSKNENYDQVILMKQLKLIVHYLFLHLKINYRFT